jgi:hypothetical protein
VFGGVRTLGGRPGGAACSYGVEPELRWLPSGSGSTVPKRPNPSVQCSSHHHDRAIATNGEGAPRGRRGPFPLLPRSQQGNLPHMVPAVLQSGAERERSGNQRESEG